MKETKQFKYEDAIHELEGIVDSMENGEMDIDCKAQAGTGTHQALQGQAH